MTCYAFYLEVLKMVCMRVCVFVAIVNMQMIINYNTLTYANKYATANSTSVADIQKNYLKSVQLYRHCYHCNTLCTRCEWNLWNIHDKYFAFHGGNGGSSGGCGGGSGRLNTIHIIICRDLYEGVVNGRCLLGGVVMLSQKGNHNLIIIICMHRSKFLIEEKTTASAKRLPQVLASAIYLKWTRHWNATHAKQKQLDILTAVFWSKSKIDFSTTFRLLMNITSFALGFLKWGHTPWKNCYLNNIIANAIELFRYL